MIWYVVPLVVVVPSSKNRLSPSAVTDGHDSSDFELTPARGWGVPNAAVRAARVAV